MRVLHLVDILQHVRQVLQVRRVSRQFQHALRPLLLALPRASRLAARVLQAEIRPEVLDISGVLVLADFLVFAGLVVEGGLVELVVDGLVFLVVDQAVQDASFLGRVLGLVVALEELLLGSGQVDFPFERVLGLMLVAGNGLGLEVHEVEVVVLA